jgi:cyclophilin family peptidyl-prolyl cis-trans isomerase
MMKRFNCLHLLLLALVCQTSHAWIQSHNAPRQKTVVLSRQNREEEEGSSTRRRHFLNAAVASSMLMLIPESANAVTRAVGGAEEDCRAAGNCLEIGEWDGAVGWSWGAKDRCDATDPRCGPDGKLQETAPSGDAVPTVTHKITQIVQVDFAIGRGESGGIILGLYGDDAPASVKQFLQFVTKGLRTTSELAFQNGMGVESMPVSLTGGGILGQIVPGQRIDFGVPSQSAAYARSRGMSKAGDDFLAQSRPKDIIDDPILRSHDVAGLLSIPGKGIGWGGSGFESDDECFESSFQITAASVPSMDKKEGRRVIGQVIDQASMANLSRLASLPVKKGFKGVIPGQNSGPPLLRVTLTGVSVSSTANAQD